MKRNGKTLDIAVVGGANYDYLAVADRNPRAGETVRADTFYEGPGGKGANQAVAAARLGAKVALIAKIGSDKRGEVIRARLIAEHVDVDHLFVARGEQTAVALITVGPDAEKQITAYEAANRKLAIEDLRRARHTLEKARVVLITLEVPIPVVYEAVSIARAAHAEVILDPAPATPLPHDLLAQLDVLRPNATEAELLARVPVTDRASARRAADVLLKEGVGAVIVQAGGEGDLFVAQEGEELFLPRLEVEAVDATGAGDAFAGTLAAMIARGASLEDAVRHAGAAAAFATTRVGAQAGLPTMEELRELLNRQEAAA